MPNSFQSDSRLISPSVNKGGRSVSSGSFDRESTVNSFGSLSPVVSEASESFVEVQSLCFSRGARIIYDNLTMAFPKGKITAVMGPSGTGKTTLLKLIGGQLRPSSGTIVVDGVDIVRAGRGALFAARKRMGMLFQSGALFTDLSVFENVAFPIRAHTDLPEDMIRDIVLMKLHSVGLRGARDLMPSEMSGGMARRVALARAIALDPEMVMYDEPFTGQDPISMSVLLQLIRLLNDSLGLTSIIVSHDVQETLNIADYLYIIADGRVIGAGEPEEIMNSDSALVRQFMLGLPDGPVPFHFPAQNYRDELIEGGH